MSTVLPGVAVAGAVLSIIGPMSGAATHRSQRSRQMEHPSTSTDLGGDDTVHDPTQWARRRPVHVVIGIALALLLGPLPVVGAVFARIAVGRLRSIRQQRRAQRNIHRDLPEALDLFVLLLEAGVSTRSVVAEMARRAPASTRPAFVQVARRLDIGEPFTEAIVQLRVGLGPGATALVDLVTASHRYGLPMAQVVSQLSTEARAARRRHNEGLARALPVKLSFPLVVCTLPSFVLLAIVPAVMAALTSLGSNSW